MVLGVWWDTASDQFEVNLDEIALTARVLTPMKLNNVGLMGRNNDLLEFLAPIVFHLNIFFLQLGEATLY